MCSRPSRLAEPFSHADNSKRKSTITALRKLRKTVKAGFMFVNTNNAENI